MFARHVRKYLWISFSIGVFLLTACTSKMTTPSPETEESEEAEESFDAEAYPLETMEEVPLENEAYPLETLEEAPLETEAYPVETAVDEANPNSLSSDPVPQTIQTSDGVELQGTFYPAARVDAPLIVLMHWAGGDQDDWKAIAPWLQNRGAQPEVADGMSWLNPDWFPHMHEGVSFNVFTFTFRGCDGGCQTFDQEGWLLDIQAVMTYVRGLENVDLSRVATIGASIGADGAAVGCDAFNAESPGCQGALSLSPGGYLRDSYADEVAKLETDSPPVPAWCLYATGDTQSAEACLNAAGDLYQTTEYEGSAHGMVILSPESEPNPLTRALEFLNEIGICDACP